MPQDYIATQGLSPKLSPEEAAKLKDRPREYKPMMVKPSRLFTETYVKEMKILINEVLDEREYKRKLEGGYDNPEPPPQSYFDLTGREYPVQ